MNPTKASNHQFDVLIETHKRTPNHLMALVITYTKQHINITRSYSAQRANNQKLRENKLALKINRVKPRGRAFMRLVDLERSRAYKTGE